MSIFTNRIEREAKTVKAMIQLYCKNHHGLTVMDCDSCAELQNYAMDRLHNCPFHEGKTSCKNCPIHCYKPSVKDDIKQVMRYSGPRMMFRHPVLTIFHFIDNTRKEPLTVLGETRIKNIDVAEDCNGPTS